MSSPRLRSRNSVDRFAWQYSFYAYLLYRQVPLPATHLASLAQVLHAIKGHRNPIAVADEVLLTWPLDLTE